MLVAAGEGAGRSAGRRPLDRDAGAYVVGDPSLLARLDERAKTDLVEVGQRDIPTARELQAQARALAVFREKSDPLGDGVGGRCDIQLAVLQDEAACGPGVHAEDGLGNLGAPGADETGHANDLAATNLEAHVLDPGLGRQAVHPDEDVADLDGAAREEVRQLAAHHVVHDLRNVHRGHRLGVHEPAVAKDADFIRQVDDLFEPVRDVDDGEALASQSTNGLEESLSFGLGQRRGGLVHDEDRGVVPQGLENLDDLAVACGKALDSGGRIDLEIVASGQLIGLRGHATVTDHEGQDPSGFGAEVDVLGDREVLGQVQLLVDHRDACLKGLSGTGEDPAVAADLNLSPIWLVDAREDLHQRGLSCAVLADQGMHRTRADGQTHVAQRLHRTEVLRYPGHLQGDFLGPVMVVRHGNHICELSSSMTLGSLSRSWVSNSTPVSTSLGTSLPSSRRQIALTPS